MHHSRLSSKTIPGQAASCLDCPSNSVKDLLAFSLGLLSSFLHLCFSGVTVVFVLSLFLLPSLVFTVVLNGGASSFSFFRHPAKQVFEIIGQTSAGWLETLSRQLVHESLCMDMHRSTYMSPASQTSTAIASLLGWSSGPSARKLKREEPRNHSE